MKKKYQKVWFWISFGLLIIIVSAGSLCFLRYNAEKRNQAAIEFVKQIIYSVVNQTDYYTEHSVPQVIKDVTINEDKISVDYKIKTLDYDLSFHEYIVIFNEKNEFYVGVVRHGKNDYYISQFVLDNHRNR